MCRLPKLIILSQAYRGVKSTQKIWRKCHHASECELGEWSQWSSCMKKNKTCGFKKGSQTRVRLPLPQIHSVDTSPTYVPSQTCAPETERRKCVVTKMPCARVSPTDLRG
ncbi:hypothetical protein CHARACLAT_026016 [Characodon lateralis]|uniref:Uncharacterized protein n=1 Tax=Characodon lateralis TaxID=208331 RepID=A0ABU7D4Y2_9TELE|nr:hypothetical protein [Characodon lateralis]